MECVALIEQAAKFDRLPFSRKTGHRSPRWPVCFTARHVRQEDSRCPDQCDVYNRATVVKAACINLHRQGVKLMSVGRVLTAEPQDFTQVSYSPTPEEIRAACAQMRSEWTEEQRESRLAARRPLAWCIPAVIVSRCMVGL